MKRLTLAAGLAAALCTALPAAASTIDPSDFETIFTEGGRTTTIDGADISGNAAVAGNKNIGRFDFGRFEGPSQALFSGRVGNTGRDQWESRGVSGWLTFDVLNFTARKSNNTDPFSAKFMVFVNGKVVDEVTFSGTNTDLFSTTFAPILLDNADLRLRVKSLSGKSAYDISANIQPIALSSSLPLLLTAGGALTWAARRKKRLS